MLKWGPKAKQNLKILTKFDDWRDQGGSDGAKKCDIQNLKWGGILFDQN